MSVAAQRPSSPAGDHRNGERPNVKCDRQVASDTNGAAQRPLVQRTLGWQQATMSATAAWEHDHVMFEDR